ncbi:hypothetical protein AVEN_141545-1 [Araneus ventricosus]|uniref:MATH domain-containing protein n=1 Tax=Araneus ventricosus TaxID=182803 RepID=A0A4Y2PAS6_ARAVE|nr:hypothetical protein AVEN_141545-1 [Araneus ventricosus]
MAYIDDQPLPVEIDGENCHEVEFNFTLLDYHDVETVGYTKEHKIKCRTLKTEWSVWLIFQKQDPDISCIINICRTDVKETTVTASFGLTIHNPVNLEFKEIATFPETEVERNWNFKQTVRPVVPAGNAVLLDGGNLSVKFCLKVAGCH